MKKLKKGKTKYSRCDSCEKLAYLFSPPSATFFLCSKCLKQYRVDTDQLGVYESLSLILKENPNYYDKTIPSKTEKVIELETDKIHDAYDKRDFKECQLRENQILTTILSDIALGKISTKKEMRRLATEALKIKDLMFSKACR